MQFKHLILNLTNIPLNHLLKVSCSGTKTKITDTHERRISLLILMNFLFYKIAIYRYISGNYRPTAILYCSHSKKKVFYITLFTASTPGSHTLMTGEMHYTPLTVETHVNTEVYRHDNGWNTQIIYASFVQYRDALVKTQQEVKKGKRFLRQWWLECFWMRDRWAGC